MLLLTLRSVVVAGSARPFTLSIEQISSHFRLHALPVLRSEAPVLALGLDVHLTHLFCTPACTESLLFSLGFRHPLLPSLSDPFPLPICRCDYSPSSFTSSLLHCSAIRRPPRGDHQGRALQEHRSQGHRPGGEAPLGDLTRFLPLVPASGCPPDANTVAMASVQGIGRCKLCHFPLRYLCLAPQGQIHDVAQFHPETNR